MTGEAIDGAVDTLDALLKSHEDADLEQLRRHVLERAVRRAGELLEATGKLEDVAHLEALRKAMPTVAHRVAYAVVRGAARRDRKRSSTTLPSLATLAQRIGIARELVEQLVPALPLNLHQHAADALSHLAAALHQISPPTDG